MFIYNSINKKYARINRNQYTMTEAEGKIWNLALRKNKTGYRFLRQKPIGNYILDFFCHELKLGIEIDDISHSYKGEEDDLRTNYLEKLGIKIIRYTNYQVHHNLDEIIMDIQNEIKEIENILQ